MNQLVMLAQEDSDNAALDYRNQTVLLYIDGKIDLATAVINFFKPERGADISLYCEAPPGSGLGSSSTVMVALIGLFKEWLGKSYTDYEIAELAYKLERIDLGLEGGDKGGNLLYQGTPENFLNSDIKSYTKEHLAKCFL